MSSPLLGFATPTQGSLSGAWGTVVNDAITKLIDDAIAGTTTISTDADYALTPIPELPDDARQAILLCTGARTAVRTMTAYPQSKVYVVINATTGGYGVKLVATGPTTGVTIPPGKAVLVAWNGSDFQIVTPGTRVYSAASASSVTPNIGLYDMYAYNALAANLTINAPTGTASDGDKLYFRILDNGTSRTLTWDATYTQIGVPLPTSTTINKTSYVGCIYNANATRWDVVSVTTQF